MDLAKNIAQLRGQSPEQWFAFVNRKLPPVVVAVLVLLLAFNAADLTWRLLESPSVDAVALPAGGAATATATTTSRASYAALEQWAPFGTPPDDSVELVPAETFDDLPLTDLNLTLNGVVQEQEVPEPGTFVVIQQNAKAIITSGRGQQRVYGVGDAIEDVGSATLYSVFTDRVVLERSAGRLEELRWPERDALPQRTSNSRVAARPRPAPADTLSAQAALADAVGNVAQVVGQHMQFAMATENGQMIGFRVEPRGDGRIMAEVGLEPGDVLTMINGMSLGDVRNTAPLLQALGETQQANVTIRRNGQDQALVLDMGELQRLAESLQ